jgi:hypothetical protein
MQLTIDDVITDVLIKENYDEFGKAEYYIDYSKFQQVVEFYEKYKDNIETPPKELWSRYIQVHLKDNSVFWKDWFFSYCFKEGFNEMH